MSGNIDPIYSRQGDLSRDSVKAFSQPLLNAPNEYSGTALGNVVLATADPVNGSFVQRLRLKALGSNVASVLRLFVNNGLSPGLSLLAPVAPTGTPSSSGGFIPTSTTYFGCVAARDAYGGWAATVGAASTAQSTTGPSASISWAITPVTGAVEYRLYMSPTSNTTFNAYYLLTNCPNIWGYLTGAASTAGGTIAAGTNFAMVNIQTTTGTFLLPCTTTGITTTGTTSSILWTAPTVPGVVISYDYWFATAAISPGTTSIFHTGTLSPQANTYLQTLPASSYTAGTAPILTTRVQTQPPQFYEFGPAVPSSATNTINNNTFIGEIGLPATTAIATTTTVDIDYPLNIPLNPGFRLIGGLGTAVAAGWNVTPVMGKY